MDGKTVFFILIGIVASSTFLWLGVTTALGETHEEKCMNYANKIIKNWEETNYDYNEFGEKNGWLFSNMHNELCMKTAAWKKLQNHQP